MTTFFAHWGTDDTRGYFDDQGDSILWKAAMACALPFDPLAVKEIDIILPNPLKEGSLLLASDTFYYSPKNPLETLQEYAAAYSFAEYTVMSTCLRSFRTFGQYKAPCLTPFFALCPLEGGERSIWINPCRITHVEEHDGLTLAHLSAGGAFVLPLQRRSLMKRLVLTCLAYATLRREFLYFKTRGKRPSDYLAFEKHPFSRLLSKRLLLESFSMPLGEFSKRYDTALLLHAYEQLETEAPTDESANLV